MSKRAEESLKHSEIEAILFIQDKTAFSNQRYVSRKQQDIDLILKNLYKVDCRLNNQRFEINEEKGFEMFMSALHSLFQNLGERFDGQDAIFKESNDKPLYSPSLDIRLPKSVQEFIN